MCHSVHNVISTSTMAHASTSANHEMFAFSLKTGSHSVVLGMLADRGRTVRSRIMSDRVQVKLAPHNIVEIQLGSQDVLPFPRRSREYRSKRTDNETSPIDHDLVRIAIVGVRNCVVFGVIPFGSKLACRQDKAPPFHGNVDHRIGPNRTVIHSGSTIDLRTQGIIVGSHRSGLSQMCSLSDTITYTVAYNFP